MKNRQKYIRIATIAAFCLLLGITGIRFQQGVPENPIEEAEAARLAAQAAWTAFENTKGMLAKHGRMAIRGEQSRELLDPGAAVAALLMRGYADFKADSE